MLYIGAYNIILKLFIFIKIYIFIALVIGWRITTLIDGGHHGLQAYRPISLLLRFYVIYVFKIQKTWLFTFLPYFVRLLELCWLLRGFAAGRENDQIFPYSECSSPLTIHRIARFHCAALAYTRCVCPSTRDGQVELTYSLKKLKPDRFFMGKPAGVTEVWCHTILLAARHKRAHPAKNGIDQVSACYCRPSTAVDVSRNLVQRYHIVSVNVSNKGTKVSRHANIITNRYMHATVVDQPSRWNWSPARGRGSGYCPGDRLRIDLSRQRCCIDELC